MPGIVADRLYVGPTLVWDRNDGGGGSDETTIVDVVEGIGSITLDSSRFVVVRVHVDAPVRVRFYMDPAGREADHRRSIYTKYPRGRSMVYELNAAAAGAFLKPFVGDSPLYWTADAAATITLTWRSLT